MSNQPPSWSAHNLPEEFEHTSKTVDIPIGGELVTITVSLPDSELAALSDIQVRNIFKEKLVALLATYMLEKNLVEITQYSDKKDFTRKVNVRCYLAPNDQVKILREHHK